MSWIQNIGHSLADIEAMGHVIKYTIYNGSNDVTQRICINCNIRIYIRPDSDTSKGSVTTTYQNGKVHEEIDGFWVSVEDMEPCNVRLMDAVLR